MSTLNQAIKAAKEGKQIIFDGKECIIDISGRLKYKDTDNYIPLHISVTEGWEIKCNLYRDYDIALDQEDKLIFLNHEGSIPISLAPSYANWIGYIYHDERTNQDTITQHIEPIMIPPTAIRFSNIKCRICDRYIKKFDTDIFTCYCGYTSDLNHF